MVCDMSPASIGPRGINMRLTCRTPRAIDAGATPNTPPGGSAFVYLLLRWFVITSGGGACVPYRAENKNKKKVTRPLPRTGVFQFPWRLRRRVPMQWRKSSWYYLGSPRGNCDRRVGCRILPRLLTGILDAGHVAFNINNRKPSPHQSPPSFPPPLLPGARSQSPACFVEYAGISLTDTCCSPPKKAISSLDRPFVSKNSPVLGGWLLSAPVAMLARRATMASIAYLCMGPLSVFTVCMCGWGFHTNIAQR